MTKDIKVGEHILVPKHERLEQEEKKQILEKYNVSIKQLPKIKRKDPAIKDMDVEVGDVIKITRKSPTYGKFEFYRVVIE
jgi:DNA-directed RNA polymerase subunit H